jgi:hypothetical protein
MASMSPEQRKQMEAMMARQGVQMGADGAMTMKTCLTREMIERDEVAPMQGDCKVTSQSRNGNTLKVSFSCSQPPATGEAQVTYLGPEAYKMTGSTTTTRMGRTETMTLEGSGKWLASDCGNLKPLAAAGK